MKTKKYPFDGKTLPMIREQLKENKPDLEEIQNEHIRTLITQMLQTDPDMRLETSDIIANEWLTNERQEPIDLDLSDPKDAFGSLDSVQSISEEDTSEVSEY